MGSGGATNSSGQAYSIVVGVDFSETGDYALWEAFALARQQTAVVIHAVYVAAGYGPLLELKLPGETTALNAQEMQSYLQEYVNERRRSQPEPIEELRIQTHLRVGIPDDEIVDLANELRADLLVVGTHERHGVKRFFTHTVTDAIVKHCPCPVLVVRPKAYARASTRE